MNNFTVALGAALCIGVVTLIVAKISGFLGRFNEETRRIAGKMRRAQDSNEYTYWQSRLRRHYIRLLPFVSEKTAERIYSRLFRKPKHYAAEEPNDGLFHILAPSVLSVCLCAICLCGMSWAWFTVTGSAGVSSIQTASYNVTVTTDATVALGANGASTVTFNADGAYSVTITPAGNATKGYCKVEFDDTEYYTENLVPNSTLTFTVNAEANTELTVTPQWGTYSTELDANVIKNDDSIGEPITQSIEEEGQTLSSAEAIDDESSTVSNDATVFEAEAVTDPVQNNSKTSGQSTMPAQTQSPDEAVVKDPAEEESAEKTEDATSTENGRETPTVGATTDSTEAVENLGSDE